MNCKFRIGLTEAALRGFFIYDLPLADVLDYKGFSELAGQSTGGQKRLGYKTVTLSFLNLKPKSAWRLNKFVDEAIAGTGDLYLTVRKNDGSKLDEGWIDIVGTVHPLSINEITPLSDDIGFQEVRLFLNNVTILNDPSTA